jgi:hypothetical protein
MTQAPAAPPSAGTSTAATNPFPGPQAYDRQDQPYFFGRDDEIEELTSLVLTTSATLVYAPSGAGKSSLLRAGVAPVLERDFDVLVLPTVHFGTVARAGSTGDAPNSFVRTVCESVAGTGGPGPIPMDIGALAARERGESSRRVLLVLDQFEELFNDPALWAQREEFFRALTTALATHQWLRAVIALRSDYLADLVPYERMLPGRLAVRYQLENLTEEQAAEAIRAAFGTSGVPLPEQDLSRLLDLLLEDAAVPHVRAQHVNTIQLQIVCRRLWQQLVEPGAAGRPALGSDFSVRESMVQFVDGAIGTAVSETRGDEAYIRWWLETQLVTSADRRAFVLVEDTHAAGLPIRVLETLVAARLLQVEQRHGSRLVELTHDSMVTGLQASNERWRGQTASLRHWVTVALAALLVLLLAAFPLLRTDPAAVTGSYSGPLADQGTVAEFAGDGTAEVVVLESFFASSPFAVTVVERDPGSSTETTVASRLVLPEELSVAMPVDTRMGADYGVAIVPQGPVSSSDYLTLFVTDLPLAPHTAQGQQELTTAALGIPLDQGMTMLSFATHGFVDVGGVDVLARDWVNGWAVVEPSDTGSVAVVFSPYFEPGLPDSAVVTWRPLGQPEEMALGEPVTVQGATPTFRSFTTESPDPVLGAEATCAGSPQMYLLGVGTPSASEVGQLLLGRGSSAVLPLNVGAGRHVVVLSSTDGGSVDCTLTIRSFAGQPLTEFGAHDLVIDDDVGAGAHAAALPADAVLVAEQRTDMVLTTVCRDATAEPSDPSAQRFLSYLPQDGNCAIWLSGTDPPAGANWPIWLGSAGPSGGE